MVANRLAFVVLGFACIAAAAGGGYLATRWNATEIAATASSSPQPLPRAETSTQEAQETGVVADAARKAEPDSPPVAKPEPVKPAAAPRLPVKSAPTKATSPASATTRNAPLSTAAESQPPAQPDQAPPAVAPPLEAPAPFGRQEEPLSEPVKAPEPEPVPERTFAELVVAADSVIGLQMESAVTSERARVEDRVEARVIRDVRVNGQVAIPAGAHVIGTVTAVDRGGKFKERARIGIRFTTLVLADRTTLPITTETIYRYGESPSNSSAARIGGGAVGGAILGAILGGAKGAAIGAAAGAGGGAATVQAGDRNPATFPNGTQVTARFLSPVTVTIEQ